MYVDSEVVKLLDKWVGEIRTQSRF
jgi:hypothetical protein